MTRRIGAAGKEVETAYVQSARREWSLATLEWRSAPTPAKFVKMYTAQLALLMALNRQLYEVLYSDPPPSPAKKAVLREQCWALEREIEKMSVMVESVRKSMETPAGWNMQVVRKM